MFFLNMFRNQQVEEYPPFNVYYKNYYFYNYTTITFNFFDNNNGTEYILKLKYYNERIYLLNEKVNYYIKGYNPKYNSPYSQQTWKDCIEIINYNLDDILYMWKTYGKCGNIENKCMANLLEDGLSIMEITV